MEAHIKVSRKGLSNAEVKKTAKIGESKILAIIEKVRKEAETIGGGTGSPRSGKLVIKDVGAGVGGYQRRQGIRELTAEMLSGLKFSKLDYVGYGKDKESGREYGDVSRLHERGKALRIARKLGELAIGDNEKKDEVRVKTGAETK